MPNTFDTLLKDLRALLIHRQWKLATAESCTGGGVAYFITDLPGSSTWFDRGFVTYSNAAKKEMLGVSEETLSKWGAVSEETALEMAAGALAKSDAQVSLSITGIAGPDGGTSDKPVGTVWFSWAISGEKSYSEMQFFSGTRVDIRNQSIEFTLQKLIEILSV